MTLPSTLAMRSSSRPEGARMERRATSSGCSGICNCGRSRWRGLRASVYGVDIEQVYRVLRAERRNIEAPMRQRGKTPTQLLLQCAVDFRHCKAGAGLGHPRHDVAPWIHDHGIAVRFAAVAVRAALR